MAVLAPDLDGVRHFAIDEAVAMAVLREMAVRALQPLFGMNVHQMHGLAWIGADGNELPLPLPAPFFRIVGRPDLAVRVEQIALPVALEQIGRASCRERVCQYVLIAWGAVILKKKQ